MKNNHLPEVTVVMNNYNNAKYISDAILSIINQDYENISLIIIDAFSNDGSREIINDYASKYKSIKKIYTDYYIPYPAITYNLGFLSASGKYVAIADADDISLSNRISKQVTFLENNNSVHVVGSDCFEFYDKIENKIPVNSSISENLKNAAPLVRNPTIMLRREILSKHGLWNWKSEYAADYEWIYRMFYQGAKFHLISEPLLLYRKSQSNISHSKAINQSLKLLKFKIIFGIKTIRIIKFFWFKSIIDSIIYLLILLIKKFLNFMFK